MTVSISHPKKRILFIAEAVTLAHVARPLVLAGSLDSERYDIWFACSSRYDGLLRKPAHIQPRSIHSISSERFLDNAKEGRPLFDYRTLKSYVAEDLELMQEVRPDLVVSDFRLSLSVSARLANVPSATISNVYYYPFTRQWFPMPELAINRYWGPAVGAIVYHAVRPIAFRFHTLPVARLRRLYGLSPLGYDLRRTLTDADFVLYADIPALGPPGQLRPGHYYLGPVLWSPSVDLPAWWHDLPANNPVLYVTLGSSGPSGLLPAVLSGLADLPVTVIAVTAGKIRSLTIPSNTYLAEFLPGDLAVHRAHLVICNGGSPTTYQALAAGKPVLGIPANFDQHLNMQSVVRVGFGETLRSDRMTTRRVRELVSRMLNSQSYTNAATSMAAEVDDYHAPSRFGAFVEDFFRGSFQQTSTARAAGFSEPAG